MNTNLIKPVDDWLILHNLEKSTVFNILNIAKFAGIVSAERYSKAMLLPSGMSGPTAWNMCSLALCNKFPMSSKSIIDTQKNTILDLSLSTDEGLSPYTAPHSDTQVFVRCCYKGLVADFVNIAHEFGHSLQMIASKGNFIPPATREFCAFYSELTLLGYLEKNAPRLARYVRKVWNAENGVYLGKDLRTLVTALSNSCGAYHYRWNYPVARQVSNDAFINLDADEIWPVFTGESSLALIIQSLDQLKRN